MKKIKLKVYLAPLKLLTNFENPVTRFKDPKVAILTLKCLQEPACDSVKSYGKPPVTS
jgi:hypothetical protein